jgi:hypothetical protein
MKKLPIQDRRERFKNELDNLTKEKEELKSQDATDKNIKRMQYINNRLPVLLQLLKNTSDS